MVRRRAPGGFPQWTIELVETFASQSVLAIQNARLFQELARKSEELEVASRHKSEFLASMSHELRTPLNAVIGFSEVLLDRLFGDLNSKQEEYLEDIRASGRHLLDLLNDILDLSKVEAGKMQLELARTSLREALEHGVAMVSERATRQGLSLHLAVADDVDVVLADPLRLKQVILNLLTNAVKFTPSNGRIEARAGRSTTRSASRSRTPGSASHRATTSGSSKRSSKGGATSRPRPRNGSRTHALEADRRAARRPPLGEQPDRRRQHVHVFDSRHGDDRSFGRVDAGVGIDRRASHDR